MRKYVVNVIVISLIFCGTLFYVRYLNLNMKKQVQDLSVDNMELKEELETSKNDFKYYQNQVGVEKDKNIKSKGGTYSVEELLELDLEKYNKIMIVTHPDDEMIWGGGHLIEDDYFVVCVTCGMDDYRVKEFEKSMNDTDEAYVMLEYPRVVDPNLKREFNWKAAAYLTQDLENIMNLKEWDMIVTHNPLGEYGHKYHILTSQIVTSLVKEKDRDKFFYFGKWYSKDNLDKLSDKTLSEELYNRKVNIINGNYVSQKNAINYNFHMFKNENWIKYKDWKVE